MLIVLTWYIAMQLFALAAWPLAFSVCDRLHDRGYAFSKGLGLLLVTFITWGLAHLGGRVPALGFSFATVSSAWFIVLLFSLAVMLRRFSELLRYGRRNIRYIISLELVLLVGFGAMVGLKAAIPHISFHSTNVAPGAMIDHAAEKFTDFAILNSLLTSSSFPPHDAWVSGRHLNYYYFGHMLWATLIKFCSVRPEIGFNLALASAFGLSLALAFGLGYNLTRRLRWAALMAFLVVLASNLDGLLQAIAMLKTTLWDARQQNLWYVDPTWWKNYEFWRSSRAIRGTINEFPAFSFILGDLHAHVSALVINLCGWNLAVQVWRSVRRYSGIWRYEIHALDELFLAAIICGALSATNSWDVPLYSGVLALAIFCGFTGRRDAYAYHPAPSAVAARATYALIALVVAALVAVVGALLLFAPFAINFAPPQPKEGSLLKLVSPVNRSSPFEFFTHWILLAALPAAAACMLLRRKRLVAALDAAPRGNPARAAAFLLLIAAAAAVSIPLAGGWVSVTLTAAAIILAVQLTRLHLPSLSRWLIGLLLLFCVMTAFCEIAYIDDIFEGPIERINTVFKVYYGLWPLMAVATVMAARLLLRAKKTRLRARWALAFIIIAGTPYMIFGTLNRITTSTRLGHWSPPEDIPQVDPPSALLSPQARARNLEDALDGLRYLSIMKPDDYAAIMWARANLPATATLLEAPGTQYTYNGRFGTLTGRPSFDGWLSHEWGWRGAAFEDELSSRTNTAATIYTASNPDDALTLLGIHNIDYIIVGEPEREQYPALDEIKFQALGEPVYQHGGTTIYRVRKSNAAAPPPLPQP